MNIEKEKTNELSNVKKVIAVMSGKGGVGKSSVTSLIAVSLKEKGFDVGILDADITGPSIPKIFGINSKRAKGNTTGINPVSTTSGIKVMSLNLMLEKEDSPVVWRGPIIANAVKQFYSEVNWGELDYLVVDLPPGTGDVSLTTMQSLPLDGLVIVSSPQSLVNLIVKKSINMAKMMNVPILGLVENMSYFECPDCNKKIELFGKSKVDEVAKEMEIDLITKIPIDPEFVELCDDGKVELYSKINYSLSDTLASKIAGIPGVKEEVK